MLASHFLSFLICMPIVFIQGKTFEIVGSYCNCMAEIINTKQEVEKEIEDLKQQNNNLQDQFNTLQEQLAKLLKTSKGQEACFDDLGSVNCTGSGSGLVGIVEAIRVDGRWGPFSEWSQCSATCGKGSQFRNRTCNNPSPQNGGKPCSGDGVEQKECNADQCAATGDVIFITGGDNTYPLGTLKSTEVLDPMGNCSRLTSPLPDVRRAHSISTIGGNLVLCGGSFTYTSCISTRSPSGPWVTHSRLTEGRYNHASAVTEDTIHILAGGYDDLIEPATAERWVHRDGIRGWRKEQMPADIEDGPCAVSINNTIYMTGGTMYDLQPTTQTWKWNANQQWTQLADMVGPGRSRHACAIFTMGGKSMILVAGGTSDGIPSMTSAIYDIEEDTWRSIGELNQVRYRGVMVNVNENIYILGGLPVTGDVLNTVEKFDVETNEWVMTNLTMKQNRYVFAAISVDRASFC